MSDTVTQPTMMPTRKVGRGAVVSLIVWVLLQLAHRYIGPDLPLFAYDALYLLAEQIDGLITAFTFFVTAYFTRERAITKEVPDGRSSPDPR